MNFQGFPPSLLILSPRLTRTGDPAASVQGINTTTLADGALVYCEENKAEYQLDRTSAAVPDGNVVIAPVAGPGRWLKVLPAGGGGACTSNNLTITGLYACAENDSNTASGQASFAIGTRTLASGDHSHSEGFETQATGYAAHAEGAGSIASGDGSHAEGVGIASGELSHAEGNGTASGDNSHAEGGGAASGSSSHAEGIETQATGDTSHAEGNDTQATGAASHAEGRSADGYPQVANGAASHVEGTGNRVDGESAHAEGERHTVGNSPQPATLAAGGTTITMVGDQTFLFPFGAAGGSVILEPTAPVAGPPVTATVIDCPVWSSGPNETTFTLSAPIDGTTTGVNVSLPNWGRAAHAEGLGHLVLGAASSAKGIAATGLFGNTMYHGGDGRGQFGRYVASGDLTGGTSAFATALTVWAGSQSPAGASGIGALYFLRTTFVVNDETGGAWFAEERRTLVHVDSARVVTVLTDVIAYTADPMATGITTAVVSGGTGTLAPTITWPAPTANNETYAITVEWTQVSSVAG